MPEPIRTARTPAPAPKVEAKVEAPKPAAETTPADKDNAADSTPTGKANDLLATYEQSQGKPFTAEYLDINGVWEKHPTLKDEVQNIEGYLQGLISDGKLDNSTKAGRAMLADMEKKAGVKPYESANRRITKLLAYIKFRKVVDA